MVVAVAGEGPVSNQTNQTKLRPLAEALDLEFTEQVGMSNKSRACVLAGKRLLPFLGTFTFHVGGQAHLCGAGGVVTIARSCMRRLAAEMHAQHGGAADNGAPPLKLD